MHPLLALFACSISSRVVTSPFWNDINQVNNLSDPPPPHFLKKIQEAPWRGGLEPVPTEGIPLHEAEVIDGKIPSDLQGMLVRNGAGRIRIGNNQYGHWFDGDGLVTRLCIDGKSQKATYAAKYVETERFLSQQKVDRTTDYIAKAGAWTKRGKGKWWENLFSIPTNPSNTNVMFLPGDNKVDAAPSMYALAEGGNPVQMDPLTLETIGEKSFKSLTGEITNSFFSAHYATDPETGDVYNHGIILAPKAAVNIMKLDRNGDLIRQSTMDIPSLTFIHDNALSENHFIVLLPPYTAPPNALFESLLGGKPLGKQFVWNPDGSTETMAMIFSKRTLECVACVPLPLLSTYHLLDAFENPDNTNILTLRTLVYESPESRIRLEECFSDLYSAQDLPLCRMMEYHIDINECRMVSSRPVAPKAALCEFPEMNNAWGHRKRYAYTNTREEGVDFTNSLQKVDMDTGECSDLISFGNGVYAGSPVFVPKDSAQKEDDGYIFTQLYRAKDHSSDVCILNATSMKKLAQLRLAKPVPYQFHSCWYPGAF